MSVVTDVRQALAADLELAFPDADVLQGERVGKAVDREKLCVFWPGMQEVGGRVNVGEATLIVRYWPKSPKVRDDSASGVRDPGPLEDAAWRLSEFLQTKQTAYTAQGAWFVRMRSCRPDYDPDEWGVEATLTLMFDNPAVLA